MIFQIILFDLKPLLGILHGDLQVGIGLENKLKTCGLKIIK